LRGVYLARHADFRDLDDTQQIGLGFVR